MSEAEHVRARLLADGRVLDVTLSREKGNILTSSLLAKLDAALAEHESAPALGLVLVRTEGRHFSFGASVEEHRKAQAARMLSSFHAVCRRVAGYPVPIAALVQGRCLGGAFELVLAGHFVFAQRSAVFACPEIKLGVFPPVLAALGPARLGQSASERLLLTGADLSAPQAAELGLVTELVEDDVELLDAALGWYQTHIAPLSAFAVRQATAAARRSLLRDFSHDLAQAERQYLDELMAGADPTEGIEAFIARRPPAWSHA
ncbi:MAG: enoyl-CoA hydratase/isomerase family protein [Polyangiaceae bacterium]|nr:enoyl-CoA hydratase/isomerase family protein [Polyangiaceae bacterium]